MISLSRTEKQIKSLYIQIENICLASDFVSGM